MPVVPFSHNAEPESVVMDQLEFSPERQAILLIDADMRQFDPDRKDSNVSYDLRVGRRYRDHRNAEAQTLEAGGKILLLPGNAVIIETEEEVHFPKWLFGVILPKVSLLQNGKANTPTKIDPGYRGRLLITAFNHGKSAVALVRGERFCSMFMLGVEGSIQAYNKGSKQFVGMGGKRPWQRVLDRLEANLVILTVVLTILTAINIFTNLIG